MASGTVESEFAEARLGRRAIQAIRNCVSRLFEWFNRLFICLTHFVSMGYGENGGGVGYMGPSAAALPRFATGRSDRSASLSGSSMIVRLRGGIICKGGSGRGLLWCGGWFAQGDVALEAGVLGRVSFRPLGTEPIGRRIIPGFSSAKTTSATRNCRRGPRVRGLDPGLFSFAPYGRKTAVWFLWNPRSQKRGREHSAPDGPLIAIRLR